MNIIADCRHIDSSGIGVYLQGCLPYMLDSGHNFVLLGSRQKLAIFAENKTNVRIVHTHIKPFSIEELCLFPSYITSIINSADAYWTPYFNIPAGITIPVYTTIHDIIFFDMPELVSKFGFMLRKWFYKRAALRSKTIFTVSQFSKSRIQFHLGNKLRVIVSYSALQKPVLDWNGPYPAKTKTIIFVGNIKEHKGLSLLIQAFRAVVQRGLDYRLIITGSKESFRSRDDAALLDCNTDLSIQWTGAVDSDRLLSLLSSASLLVQPSLYEGFGLPPLEALACRTPVLISDIPVFKEIYSGFPVHFFKSGDVTDLEDKMFNLLYDDAMQTVLLSDTQKNRYTFFKTAQHIMEELCRTD